MSDQALIARRLLNHQSVGVLSTHSIDVEGYPFGSIAPYALNYESEPTILISDIAQHTRNIKHNNKVSLTVFDQRVDDPQSNSRLTWIGDAELIDPRDTRFLVLSYSFAEGALHRRVWTNILDRAGGDARQESLSRSREGDNRAYE